MIKHTVLAALLTIGAVGSASAAPITGSFSLGLASGSYVGGSATAATATGLDFGMSALAGGTGAGNGFGVNGSGVAYNSTGSFAALNGTNASVADIALGSDGIATANMNPFITLGSYVVTIANATYTRSPLGTSVTVTGNAAFTDGVAADATTGTFALSTSSQDGNASNVNFTFTSNVAAAATAVPEPISMSLLGAGLIGMGAIRLRRKA